MSAPVTLNRVVDVLCLVMLLICLYNYIYSVLLNSVRNHSLDGATCWFHVFHVKGKRLITGVGVGDLYCRYLADTWTKNGEVKTIYLFRNAVTSVSMR